MTAGKEIYENLDFYMLMLVQLVYILLDGHSGFENQNLLKLISMNLKKLGLIA